MYDSTFDAKIRSVGNSYVITVPAETVQKLNLQTQEILEVGIRRPKID